ncbi:zeta toxin family protein [Asticcacaulis solisilvae]|uniref:zeta toxin family protein n=1 Tax=Asticcacaulis solisilvae TaxID=1217274 RepID=UPI003FD78823
MPRCLIIAGPNGAGKTTFALKYLRRVGVDTFINADMIASGLSPFHPERQAAAAGRLFLHEVEARIATREDFAIETTLSGRSYLRLIQRLRAEGWGVELYYLVLPSVGVSKTRVAERVSHGGHNIPAADIERRFPRSLRNLLDSYRMAVDECHVYLNDGDGPVQIFDQFGPRVIVHDGDLYDWLLKLADVSDD